MYVFNVLKMTAFCFYSQNTQLFWNPVCIYRNSCCTNLHRYRKRLKWKLAYMVHFAETGVGLNNFGSPVLLPHHLDNEGPACREFQVENLVDIIPIWFSFSLIHLLEGSVVPGHQLLAFSWVYNNKHTKEQEEKKKHRSGLQGFNKWNFRLLKTIKRWNCMCTEFPQECVWEPVNACIDTSVFFGAYVSLQIFTHTSSAVRYYDICLSYSTILYRLCRNFSVWAVIPITVTFPLWRTV